MPKGKGYKTKIVDATAAGIVKSQTQKKRKKKEKK
jgi:hypothetical protein